MSPTMSELVLKRHTWSFSYVLMAFGAFVLTSVTGFAQKLVYKRVMKSLKEKTKVDISEIHVPSRDPGRNIKVQIYEKQGGAAPGKKGKAVHVNFHGSGFVIPSLGTDAEFCAHIATLPETVVFDCDYRKAPSTPFPGYHFDGLDIISYIQSHSELYDVDRITLSGFSAGANLAMGVAVVLGPQVVKGLVSFYGNPDTTKTYAAPSKEFKAGVVLPEALRKFFYACVFLETQDRADMRVSPAYAPVSQWPKHLFFSCGEADSLYEPERLLAEKLKKEGLDAEFVGLPLMAHAWDKNALGGSKAETNKWETYQKAQAVIERAQQDGL